LLNRDGKLLPGVYAQMRFQSSKEQGRWVIPAKTLSMRTSGPHVVIVNGDGSLRTQKVSLGRDFGDAVEVLVGLQGAEQLVVNPSDDLKDGQVVRISPNGNDERQVAQK
jgi:multidrug efflux system membrane fusion protein